MSFTRQRQLLPTQTRRLIRLAQWLLFITGIVALVYVGLTLLDAKLYQASAKRSLQTQTQVIEKLKAVPLKPIIRRGDILGRIDIPRLGMSIAILQGTTSRTLRLGAGHIESTPLPGTSGNSGIAGHRDTFFRELRNIRQNDQIQLQTTTGISSYAVDWMKIVEPSNTSILESPTTESTLTLVTCYPFELLGPAPKRFIVHARRQ